jgi:mRNA interferase MazF
MDRDIKQGDLYWFSPPDAGQGIAHPHVIVQDDVLNSSRIHSVVVCGLTTNLSRASLPGNVLLDAGEGGLPSASVVVVTHVSAVDEHLLGEFIGALSRERVEQILAGMRFVQRIEK